MRRDWLLYLVIFSLALNFGTIGALVYFRYQPPAASPEVVAPPPREGFFRFLESLELDQDQKHFLRQRVPSHRQELRALHRQLDQQRRQLFELLKQSQPDETVVNAQIRAIAGSQGNVEQEMARFLLEFKDRLRPQQQEMLLQRVGQRLCGPACGPPGERRQGRGRWGGPPIPPQP
ncbi:MAG: periplasmic heavy metal sensor [Deltaproteobacteria bacterium]|nr:periplasmic heavy metal sensor [Deltaproteobacteria bacterium]